MNYTIQLYDPLGKLNRNWVEKSSSPLKLVHRDGLVMIVNSSFDVVFVAACGWQLILTTGI